MGSLDITITKGSTKVSKPRKVTVKEKKKNKTNKKNPLCCPPLTTINNLQPTMVLFHHPTKYNGKRKKLLVIPHISTATKDSQAYNIILSVKKSPEDKHLRVNNPSLKEVATSLSGVMATGGQLSSKNLCSLPSEGRAVGEVIAQPGLIFPSQLVFI